MGFQEFENEMEQLGGDQGTLKIDHAHVVATDPLIFSFLLQVIGHRVEIFLPKTLEHAEPELFMYVDWESGIN